MTSRRNPGESLLLRSENYVPSELAWHADAACGEPGVDPDWFFADKHSLVERGLADPNILSQTGLPADSFIVIKEATAEAKAICARCPVQVECLEYALENREQYGVWGGTTRDERKAMLRARPNPPAEDRHGTRNCYVSGCRCSECCEANRRHHRRWHESNGWRRGGGAA